MKSIQNSAGLSASSWAVNFLIGLIPLAIGLHVPDTNLAQERFPPTIRTELDPTWDVKGSVIDESGNPISGATVVSVASVIYRPMSRPLDWMPQASKVKSTRNGFTIRCREDQFLACFARGYAPQIAGTPDGSVQNFKLSAGRTISGTVLRPDGEPAVGAFVTPRFFGARKRRVANPNPGPPRRGPGESEIDVAAFENWGANQAVRTNARGEFSIPHMPENSLIGCSIWEEGFSENLIVVRPEEGDLPAFPAIEVDNDFTFKLKRCPLLKIDGVDAETGELVTIGSVAIEPMINNLVNASAMRYSIPVNSKKATISLSVKDPLFGFAAKRVVWVSPSDRGKYLGYRFEIPTVDVDTVIEKTISFRRGQTVEGIVVSESNDRPLKGARVAWVSAEGKEVTQDGDFASLNCLTGKDGRFRIGIPKAKGWLRVLGEVEGHQSFEIQPDAMSAQPEFKEIGAKYFFETNPNSSNPLGEVKFSLPASYTFDVSVQNADGSPVPHAIIQLPQMVNSGLGPLEGSMRNMNHVTDKEGRIQLKDQYRNLYLMQLAKLAPNRPTLMKTVPNANGFTSVSASSSLGLAQRLGYPARISAFMDGGLRQGVAKVPLPDKETGSTIPVTITLEDPANAVGRILNVDGSPIADLTIKASTVSGYRELGQSWKTQTRKDGMFKMQGLPAAAKLKWDVDLSRVKTNLANGKLDIDSSKLAYGETIDLGEFKVLDYSVLAEPLPELELEKLSLDEAIAALKRFQQECQQRVPEYEPLPSVAQPPMRLASLGTMSAPMSMSSAEPLPTYQERVNLRIVEAVKQVLEKNIDSKSELALFQELGFLEPSTSRQQVLNHGAWSLNQFVRGRLLERHFDDPAAADAIVEDASQYNGVVYLGPAPDKDRWDLFFERAKNEETRNRVAYALAGRLAVSCLSKSIKQQLGGSGEDENFKKLMARTERCLQIAMQQNHPARRRRLRELINRNLDHFEQMLQRQEAATGKATTPGVQITVDKATLTKVKTMLQKYVGD